MSGRWLSVMAAMVTMIGISVGAAVPAAATDQGVAMLGTSAPGTAVERGGNAVIDHSNTGDGYISVKWNGDSGDVIAIQIKGPNNPEPYNYFLRTDGDYDVFPLSDGSGTYQIIVCRNVSGTKFAKEFSTAISANLSDSFAPFLRPNQYVNYTADSEAVKKGRELTKDAVDTLGKVQAVYQWVVTNLTYDTVKAQTVQGGYLPDVDRTLREKTGICFDYASLMSAMLRSQGIPVKLVVGYTSKGEYHAWLNVWTEESGWVDGVIYFEGGAWKLMDPTFAAGDSQSEAIMEYIGNTANYKERFVY